MESSRLKQKKAIRYRVQSLIRAICSGMYEREETVAVALLAALCGQNAFLYGPPGTAKSLISRRVAGAFHKPAYFEYLMNRFSTPEEVFGPVSIKALREDHYIRKTGSYLPTAEFAFLDEIWKSSPAILNTLLTLINEKTFRNGTSLESVPLRALLAASNETPDANQGLEALFDRFIVRLMVSPINQVQHFEQLLNSRPNAAEVDVPPGLQIRSEEWHSWGEQIHAVGLSADTLTIVHMIREQLAQQYDALKVYVSDRRWQKAALLMKASAFFNGRMETNHSDALLLQHCIWTHKDNHDAVIAIVEEAVKSVGVNSGYSLAGIDEKKEALDREINSELFHSVDVYRTEKSRNGEEVFKVLLADNFRYWNRYEGGKPVFIPYKKMKSVSEFEPLDQSGNAIDELLCRFDGQGACTITEVRTRQTMVFNPHILFHKGDKKDDVNRRLVASLSESVSDIKHDLRSFLEEVTKQSSKVTSEIASIFVPAEKTDLAVLGLTQQIEGLKLRIKDCERLEGLCG